MVKEDKKINIICDRRLEKYFAITEKALAIIKKSITKGKEKEAKEIINMASAYVFDAHYFEKEGHYVNAFAALNYAHGWIDTGARLGIFDVTDNQLFVIK